MLSVVTLDYFMTAYDHVEHWYQFYSSIKCIRITTHSCLNFNQGTNSWVANWENNQNFAWVEYLKNIIYSLNYGMAILSRVP